MLVMEQLWLDGKWGYGPNAFENFVKKHNNWLTVVGVAIVFVTFVVKDAYRESLRDSVSAITEAQQSFLTTMGMTQIGLTVTGIDTHLQRDQSSGNGSEEDQLEIAETSRQTLKEIYTIYGADLDSISRLLRTLPPEPEDEKTCRKMKVLVSAAEESVSDPESAKKVVEESLKNPDPMVKSITATLYGVVLGMPLAQIMPTVEKLQKRVIWEADRERDIKENRVRRATVASYILYPLGLVVSLIGRLYGEGKSDDDAD
jgi:hypothetical protein